MTVLPAPGPASGPFPGCPFRFGPGCPGRGLGPVALAVGSIHAAWLEPARDRCLASGYILAGLGLHVVFAESKLAEFLRGVGHYPRWEVMH
ncbi:hypothetical protein [Streptomyces nitrosporeus]|uniref:hypothetical protein n=1 Tax=Streptomyces nitrosporeus TaxID=28894 RepID=UPI0039A15E78